MENEKPAENLLLKSICVCRIRFPFNHVHGAIFGKMIDKHICIYISMFQSIMKCSDIRTKLEYALIL